MRATESLMSQMNLLKMQHPDALAADQHRFLAMTDEAAAVNHRSEEEAIVCFEESHEPLFS